MSMHLLVSTYPYISQECAHQFGIIIPNVTSRTSSIQFLKRFLGCITTSGQNWYINTILTDIYNIPGFPKLEYWATQGAHIAFNKIIGAQWRTEGVWVQWWRKQVWACDWQYDHLPSIALPFIDQLPQTNILLLLKGLVSKIWTHKPNQ